MRCVCVCVVVVRSVRFVSLKGDQGENQVTSFTSKGAGTWN